MGANDKQGDDIDMKAAAKAFSQLGASKGGKARAEKLTPEQRREIAIRASEARWSKDQDDLPMAVCASPNDRPLRIGEIELQAYVLEDGTRLLSQAEFLEALGRHRKANVRNEGGEERLPAILQGKSIKPFIPNDLIEKSRPVKFRTPTGVRASGYRAELLPDVCEIYLKARDAGVLPKNQQHVAKQADILIRGLARVGIIALVDEATGYQNLRGRKALEEILEKFISAELMKWVKTFPDEFYRELFRLREWHYDPKSSKRPVHAANLTIDLVYRRLAPGVLQELQRVIPRNEKGRPKHKLFQRLTEDVGHPRLREHLASVIALMKAFDRWEQFYSKMDRVFPKYNDTPMLNFMEKDDKSSTAT